MKIAIDISQIVYKGSGVSRFTDGLVRAICKYDDKNEWVFFFSSLRKSLDSSVKDAIRERGFRIIELKIPPTALSLVWNQLHILRIDQFIPVVDWVITSDWTEPPSRYKKATIVHDLVFKKYPETLSALILKTQEQRLHWVQKESHVIFTDSESTKNDLAELLTIDKGKVITNYPGINSYQVSSDKQHFGSAQGKQVSKSRPFILTVGKLEPRKNIERLVRAFNSLNQTKVDLYIVGMNGWGNVVVEENPQIKLLGFVPDEKLVELYRTCLFFVLPSIYEGFGYPIAEAMSYGAPVATSNTSSLKEIANSSAVLFDPHDEDSIAKVLMELISKPSLRSSLSKKGLARAKDYTWKKYYETMIKVLSSKL